MDEIVCYCFSVTRKQICQAIRDAHLKTVEEVSERCFACLGCRTCYFEIEAILQEELAAGREGGASG